MKQTMKFDMYKVTIKGKTYTIVQLSDNNYSQMVNECGKV